MSDLQILLGIVALFLFVLVIGGVISDYADRGWYADVPEEKPMCKCGVRGGADKHVHAGWTERRDR